MANIKILSPSVNESRHKYFAEKNYIRCPLAIIKNVGVAISNDIIKEREKGLFKDFCDFVLRLTDTGVNRKVITNLIYAGAISFGYNRRTLIENLDNVINYAEIAKDAGMIEIEKPEIEIYDEYSKREIIDLELKTIGFYLTEHPISKYRNNYSVNSMNIKNYFDRIVKIAVMINYIKETTTKNNDVMAFVTGADEFGEINLTMFPTIYKKFNNLKVGDSVEIIGKVEKRYDKYQVIVNNITKLE